MFVLSIAALIFVLGLAGLFINTVPEVGAEGAQLLRGVIGDQAVAQLETVVYQAQDFVSQWTYRAGVTHPVAPWSLSPTAPSQAAGVALMATPIAATPVPAQATATRVPAVAVATSTATALPATTSMPTVTPPPTATATATAWLPAALPATGALPGEGQWTAYLRSASGQVLAYRTFLQPDPQRPYAVVAIVAFDASATRLGFVMGSSEPVSTAPLDRSGRIPASAMRPGLLLATFNGGFKTQHGNFGAMANGVIAVPPRQGLGTLALYQDGSLRIGAWGSDITLTHNLVVLRQNGPLIIHNGVVNPHTADNAPQDWGYTVNGAVGVWRSGLGISADGRTLYYVAGPSLTMPALATALAATGAAQAMQLDINNFWVHFDAVHWAGTTPTATPLLDSMAQSVGRYLGSYSRDYFYVVSTTA
jgi:hypothetical protein